MSDAFSDTYLASLIPHPAPDAHKYSRGRLVCFAGSTAYPGAACLVACAGLRMGAGYVEVFTEPDAIPAIRNAKPSIVVHTAETIPYGQLYRFQPNKPCAYVVGPGFDPDARISGMRVFEYLATIDAPVLFDGGALGLLDVQQARDLRATSTSFPLVLTPHGGEAKQLVRFLDSPNVQDAQLARLIAREYGAIVVLKGPDTWISDGEREYLMDKGGPELAKAGTGDVLAGMIGALLAQGVEAFDACVLGTTLHALSAGCAAADLTDICVAAEDVIDYVPQAIIALERRARR